MSGLVQTCDLHPYGDLLGLQSPRGYVNTDVDLTVNGMFHRVYLSETLAGEYAGHFGWISPGEAKQLRDGVKNAKEQGYAEGFQAAIDKLRSLGETLVTA